VLNKGNCRSCELGVRHPLTSPLFMNCDEGYEGVETVINLKAGTPLWKYSHGLSGNQHKSFMVGVT